MLSMPFTLARFRLTLFAHRIESIIMSTIFGKPNSFFPLFAHRTIFPIFWHTSLARLKNPKLSCSLSCIIGIFDTAFCRPRSSDFISEKGWSTFFYHVLKILGLSSKKQMLWVYTRWVIAMMAYIRFVWNIIVGCKHHSSMRQHIFTVYPQEAISRRQFCSLPFPTSIRSNSNARD